MKNITVYRRLLLFLFSAGLATFLAFGFVSVLSLYFAQREAVQSGAKMGITAGASMEEMTTDILMSGLSIVAQDKSHLVDRELRVIKDHSANVALVMRRILEHPENRKPRTLKAAESKSLKAGEACIYYAPNARSAETKAALAKEIGVSSSIADTLENIASFYMGSKGFFAVASENGYYITVNTLQGNNTNIEFSDKFLSSYVPKDSEWYKKTAESGTITIGIMPNDENTNLPFITVSTPYYNGNEFAGVANIAINAVSLHQLLEQRGINDVINANFILNSKGELVLLSENGGLSKEIGEYGKPLAEGDLARVGEKMIAGETGVESVVLNGESYYLAYAPIPSLEWSLGMLAKADDILRVGSEAQREADSLTGKFVPSMSEHFQKNLLGIGYMLPVVLFAILMFGTLTAKRFVAPILQITAGVREIAKGDFEKKLNLTTGDEFEELANSIDIMTNDIKAYMENIANITKDKQRIATELSLAQDIQIGMLPDIGSLPAKNAGYDLYATMEAAKTVGGDFYDFYSLDENRVAVMIADVSGKGVPAALFMAIAKTLLQNSLSDGHFRSISETAAHINNLLKEDNTKMMFVTAFIGVLNIKTGNFSFVNCGHNPPLIYRAECDKYEYIEVLRNTALGVMSDMNFTEQEITLNPKDALFLYTDGVTEACNESEEMYGEDRLQTALNAVASPNISSEEILTKIREDLKKFVGTAEQSDDITMLGIRFNGYIQKIY